MAESALVSGGTGGIGRAVVRGLNARGWRPVVGYRASAEAAKRLAAEIDGQPLALDLCDEPSIDAAVERLVDLSPRLGAVVLAASPPPTLAPFTRADPSEASRHWRVNVLGPRLLLAGLVKHCLRTRRRGVIVAVLTQAMGSDGVDPTANMTDYVTAKHGLAGMLRALGAEHRWLRIETVRPGFVETPMLEAFDQRLLETLRSRAPGGRFTSPEEVAREICDKVGDPVRDDD
jgi:3-oxoacyl-[acyl-carrier protein] reductase